MQISETLLSLRNARGLSQEALAEALDVSRQAVSKWETGAALPDVDKIIQLSEFYGVTTDYILKNKSDDRTEASAHDAPPAADGQPGAGPSAPSGGAAAAVRSTEAAGVFVRVWPILCLAVSAAVALLFCILWFMRGLWFASTFAHAGFVAAAGTIASAFGAVLFELGAVAVPALRRRRAFFYSYAVWALALLPCCAVSGIIDSVFSNWLSWRLENAFGWAAESVVRMGCVYLLPLILYGGACTSLRESLLEEQTL